MLFVVRRVLSISAAYLIGIQPIETLGKIVSAFKDK